MAKIADTQSTVADGARFPSREYAQRLTNVRARMDKQQFDGLLVTKPENIYYLTGLDHQGFFAFHLLIVPADGAPTLIARAMEHATVKAQLPGTPFVGYSDDVDPVTVIKDVIDSLHLTTSRLGIEKESLCFPPSIYEALRDGLQQATWSDASPLVDELRLIKSPLEINYTRQAAQVSDAMMRAALETAQPGVSESQVAAEIHRAMILSGGEYPGFTPFIRPSPRIAQEHTTWRQRDLRAGEALFLEMAGCVGRYHAPQGRLVYLGTAPPKAHDAQRICLEAFGRIVDAIRPGVTASQVYASWQQHIDDAGIRNYHRHHCGYLVGLGFPPSWTGGSTVVGLRHDSELVLQTGMVFHAMSWLLGSDHGDYFISNTVVLTEQGGEVLTQSPVPLVAD